MFRSPLFYLIFGFAAFYYFDMISFSWFGNIFADDQSRVCLNIEGWDGCGYLEAAKRLASELDKTKIKTNVKAHERSFWRNERIPQLQKLVPNNNGHSTSPFVYEGCSEPDFKFVGGYTEMAKKYKKQ